MKQPIVLFTLLLTLTSKAQPVQHTEPFAPSTGHLHPSEMPYRQSICLNGSWQFQPIPLPSNFQEGIDPTPSLAEATNNWDKTPIRIPSPWNVNSFADRQGQGGDFRTYPSYPKTWETVKMAWLKKDFTIPSAWKGKRISLYFEALAGDAEIIVNGKPAGHKFDIFLPFSIDITDLVNYGKHNDLRIGVRKPSLFDRRGQYGRRPYQAGSFWGQHIAGIWQDVYVEALPAINITDTYIRPLVDKDKLEADLTIANETATTQTLTIGGDICRWIPARLPLPSTQLDANPTLRFPNQNITIPPHATITQTLSITVNNQLQKWSPDTPALYGLVANLSSSTQKKIDIHYTRFGWRQTTIQNGQFLLNGQPFVLKGDSWHFLGIPQMTRRYAWAWYTAMRDAHLNAVRLHAQPYPPFYLDIADEMGILVLDETAVWASDGGPKLDDPIFWQDTRDQLQQQILRDRNHPSVFGWSVSNEVKPVIRNVMHGPQKMMDTLLNNFTLWAETCRSLDPTRPWISADGEDDGDGRLPLYIVHYGGTDAMDRARRSSKPWGVGEAGNAYYATPQQVAETNGSRAYQSFLGRMEGVAISSWSSLMAQRSRDAVYRSVFNLVWYGLQPLPLGMKDTTRPPTIDDGIFFTSFKEGQPGVQPERLGPYCTTLNPGYDPSLPLYRTWPLFDAIKDASSPNPSEKTPIPIAKPQSPTLPLNTPAVVVDATQSIPTEKIRQTLAKGGTVLILGIDQANIKTINHLLPSPLTLTQRTASSLDLVTPDPITKNITAADLYFSELRPPEIITNGLDGPLVQAAATPNVTILLQSSNTDWLKWNKQPEYAKTAMVLRSERETKPSGVALIRINNLLLSTLPANPHLEKAQQLIDKLKNNLGVHTDTTTSTLLLTNGDLTPDLRHLQRADTTGQAWLDFWISSPRSLEDLLSEPDIPVVGLQLSNETLKIYLNDHPLLPIDQKLTHTIPALRLQQGWNHIRILLQQTPDGYTFTGRLVSNHPQFLKTLSATMNKP